MVDFDERDIENVSFKDKSRSGSARKRRDSYDYMNTVQMLGMLYYSFEPRREKTSVLVSDLVRHKPGCAFTEDG